MRLYRLIKTTYVSSVWSGHGAQMYGWRWNHKNFPAVYLASSISLAVLECLVHLDDDEIIRAYTLYQIDIDDNDIQVLDSSILPAEWCDALAPAVTMDIGTDWLKSYTSVGLIVPSTVVPYENNVIINPKHVNFSRYEKNHVIKLDFNFDSRLVNISTVLPRTSSSLWKNCECFLFPSIRIKNF